MGRAMGQEDPTKGLDMGQEDPAMGQEDPAMGRSRLTPPTFLSSSTSKPRPLREDHALTLRDHAPSRLSPAHRRHGPAPLGGVAGAGAGGGRGGGRGLHRKEVEPERKRRFE